MGYCPIELKVGLGTGRAGRARGTQAGRAGVGGSDARGARVRGRAAGSCKGARGGRLGGLGAAWACSWAKLGVLVHLTQFLVWFDSVFS